jgi:rare lipoprotein A (peptidoglycan hydrolase)
MVHMLHKHSYFIALLSIVFIMITAAYPYLEDINRDKTNLTFNTKQSIQNYDKTVIGKASWYGTQFHGRLTANGEIYNMHTLTAAHKSLPFDTLVKVTNLDSGESVIVRINDRGPYVQGRNIDLSYEAAKHIGLVGTGVGNVKMEILLAKGKFSYQKRFSLLPDDSPYARR